MDADVAERLVPLEGGVNFRDMGGYETADGRRVKWRTLYRSGMMTRLTSADIAHLKERGIRTVVDLRTVTEQTNYPSHWCREAGVTYWRREHEEVFGNLHAMIEAGIPTVEAARDVMLGGFRELPFQQGPAYAELFRRIAAGEVPIVFNCMAGKDRTGGAAALVLAALGVPREAIAADFAMTDRAVDLKTAFGPRSDDTAKRYATIPPEISKAISGAHPDNIHAFLDSIDERCGSLEGYLEGIGIGPAELAAVREQLLD
jgi:protein-tyrosine phosphatase